MSKDVVVWDCSVCVVMMTVSTVYSIIYISIIVVGCDGYVNEIHNVIALKLVLMGQSSQKGL